MKSFQGPTAAFESALMDFAQQNKLPIVPNTPALPSDMRVTDRTTIGRVYNAVVQMMNESSLYGSRQYDNTFAFENRSAMESMSAVDYNADRVSSLTDKLYDLCQIAQTPATETMETMRSLQQVLHRYLGHTVQMDHWSKDNSNSQNLTAMNSVYPSGALSDVSFDNKAPGQEAFGATMDTVLPDIRMAMTVVLLKPHKGIMSRLIHRRTIAGSVIQYVINNDEFYDLTKSQDKSGEVRNSWSHRIPIVALYRNPNPVNMQLQPIIPQKALDVDDKYLVADGIMKFNVEVNMFDLTLDPQKIGYNNVNYTDLVSENVVVDSVYFNISNAAGTVIEQYKANTSSIKNARLNMPAQVDNSGERVTNLQLIVQMNKNTAMSNGQANALFSSIQPDADYHVEVVMTVAPRINLMTAIAEATSHARLSVGKKTATAIVPGAVQDMVTGSDAYTVELVGYSLDAKFSEENLRKTNMSIRSLTYTAQYELPQGKSIVVDFSMQQSVPEHVLNTAQEVQAIGIDHRNLQAFLKLMREVHDQGKIEDADPLYRDRNNGRSLNTTFISGQRVNPTVIMNTIDLTRVVNIRSSDLLGDIRQFMDSFINKTISLLHWRSLYTQQLDNGEIPTYKVLTSGPIIENLFSIPHIHNHLHPQGMEAEQIFRQKKHGEPIEFTRVLPSGVKLECISTPFKYMQNQIMIIPFRSGDAASELNFAHNWDGGQFVANYTPVDQNQVNKRVYMNTREWPIPTCPCGVLIRIEGLETIHPNIVTEY